MANRHLSRSIALQSLFEWDFREAAPLELPVILRRNAAEFAPGLTDLSFSEQLTEGVLANQKEIDGVIEKAAPEWPVDRIAFVDRSILRLGLFELIFGDRSAVPARVAINEAIELAKTFGGESSGKFVNGVLGTVYREMGEPDRDEIPAKKRRVTDLPPESWPVENLAGAVVFTHEAGELYFALVHDVFGYWTLSKGHIEDNETPEVGVAREVREELTVEVIVRGQIGGNEYVANDPERGRVRKRVTYFLAEVAGGRVPLRLGAKEGLDDARWFAVDELSGLRLYNDLAPIITKGAQLAAKL